MQHGSDINITKLVEQRDRTKDRSLRVLFFGSRDIYRTMLKELSHSQSRLVNITWLVVEHPEDTASQLDVVTDSIPAGTLVVSQARLVVLEAEEYVMEKWKKVSMAG